jgi:hypothetical protein
LFIVSRVCVALLVGSLLGLPLSACSRSKVPVPEVDFEATRAAQESADPQAAMEAAREFCQEEARRKGIASVTRLLLLRGKVSKSDYVECMQARGYAVAE